MPRVLLSEVAVDFEQIVEQFNDDMNKRATLVNLTPAAVGQAIIDYIGSIAAYHQFSIQRAAQETFVQLAKQPNSILTGARMLGVHLTRALSAQVTVALTNANPATALSISAYSQFIINNTVYAFNRSAIVFNAGSSAAQTVTLYEGQVTQETIIASGGSYQLYYLGTPGQNNISDTDLFCTINGSQFNPVTDGLWQYQATDQVFYTNTSPDGTVEVRFGNDVYGVAPIINSPIVFTYIITQGAAGNNSTSGLSVALSGSSAVTGTTTSNLTEGADPLPPSFYSVYAPTLHAAQESAVKKIDFKPKALQFAGVIDVLFLGQYLTNPNDVRYMCAIQYTLLASPAFSDTQHSQFVAYMMNNAVYGYNFIRYDPTAVTINVTVTLYCFSNANLANVQGIATTAITNLLALKDGSLGYSIYLSDLYDALTTACAPYVDYMQFAAPTSDTVLTQFQYPVAGTISVTANYSTRLTALNSPSGSGGGGN